MTAQYPDSFLEAAIRAAKAGGEIIIKNLGGLSSGDIRTKQAFDFVTKVDHESESAIIETIRSSFPSHIFLSEETLREKDDENFRWIIDPLDGTKNFIHSYPMFAVSIGLQHKGELVLGVVLDPVRGELFHAVKGGGAFLNGNPVYVSGVDKIENSLVATGFPFRKKELTDDYLRLFRGVFDRVSDLRRAGSAALDLAYVAAGRLDAFFELALSPWDIAAGALLITEAGGTVTGFTGGPEYLETGNIVAGNPYAHSVVLGEVKKVFGGWMPGIHNCPS